MSATIVDDLVNWTLFAIILSDIAPSSGAAPAAASASAWCWSCCCSSRFWAWDAWLGPRALGRVRPHVAWPSGFIAVIALLVLLASSASEALGIHAFLGAFLVGVALGDARDEQKEAHDVIGHSS